MNVLARAFDRLSLCFINTDRISSPTFPLSARSHSVRPAVTA